MIFTITRLPGIGRYTIEAEPDSGWRDSQDEDRFFASLRALLASIYGLPMLDLVLPIVHLNGTSLQALVDQRCEAADKVLAAMRALDDMAPNGRDYYPEPGRFEQAQAQHERRVAMLRGVLTELTQEAALLPFPE